MAELDVYVDLYLPSFLQDFKFCVFLLIHLLSRYKKAEITSNPSQGINLFLTQQYILQSSLAHGKIVAL